LQAARRASEFGVAVAAPLRARIMAVMQVLARRNVPPGYCVSFGMHGMFESGLVADFMYEIGT
jgi:hypothetical protein